MRFCQHFPRYLLLSLLSLFCYTQSHAADFTTSGVFSGDDSVYEHTFTSTSSLPDFTFSTSSYTAGGFVPVLTLFSSTGSVIGSDGGDGKCYGSGPSASTHICDDAFFTEALAPGTYTLALTEFPNVAIGNLSDGFLFAGDHTATGDFCGVSGGKFLQTDIAPCAPRSDEYNLSIASTPEPASWLLVLPPAVLLCLYSRRRFV